MFTPRGLLKLLDVREGEVQRTFFMFAYSFLMISCLMIIKPVCYALFLTRFGVRQLPFAYILVAAFAALSATLYGRLLHLVPLNRLIANTLKLFILTMLIFWVSFRLHLMLDWMLYAFFVLVAVFGLVCASQFWILANLLFSAREAKRLFGVIGSGAIAGGVAGGYLTKLTAEILGSENLVFIATGCLLLCIPLARMLWQKNLPADQSDPLFRQRLFSAAGDHPLKLILRSRHLLYLAAIVGLGVVVAKLVDYQFSAIASIAISDDDRLSAFFGFWLSNLNLASLIVQLFVTRRVVGVFGVGTSLYILPVGILIGALATLASPVLWSAVLIKISDGSLKNSINKAGIELLSLPIRAEIKNQTKTFIDVFVDSIATGVGGVLLVLLTHGLELSTRLISSVIIMLLLVWLFLIQRIKWEYIQQFRLKVEDGTTPDTLAGPDLDNESVLGGLIRVLDTGNEKEIIRTLKMVADTRNQRLLPSLTRLMEHPSAAVRLEALKNLYYYPQVDVSSKVAADIQHPDQNLKTEAMRYLYRHARNREPFIWPYLNHEDYRIQGAALLCIAQEIRSNQRYKKIFGMERLIQDRLKKVFKLKDAEQTRQIKTSCIQVISVANIPELHAYLHILMNDPDPEVVKAAIRGAGESRHPDFIPVLLRFLGEKPVQRHPAHEALISYGPGIIDILGEHMKNPYVDRKIRQSIPRVIAHAAIQKSVDVLVQNLAQDDQSIRYEVIRALNRLRITGRPLRFDKPDITGRIHDEARTYLETLKVLAVQMSADKAVDNQAPDRDANMAETLKIREARRLLIKALEERLDVSLERLFRLLGLKYPPQDVYNVYRGIRSERDDVRTSALELLDNVLDVDLKRLIMPIVETAMMDHLTETSLKHLRLRLPDEFESVTTLLSMDDSHIKALVLYLLGLLRDERAVPFIGKLIHSTDPEVRDMARFALRRMAVFFSR